MDYDRAKSALSGTRFPDLRHVSETGSTNADVAAMFSGVSGGGHEPRDGHVVLVADHQSAGRGRLDRTWEAPHGSSVLMTIGLPLGSLPIERVGLVTMALSLATLDAISELGVDSVRLKWPNDIVLPEDRESSPGLRAASDAQIPVDGDPHRGFEAAGTGVGHHPGYRKMGGVLAELVQSPSYGTVVVMGIGLNVNWGTLPDHLTGSAVSLDELKGEAVDRWDLIVRLVSTFDTTWWPLVLTDPPQRLLDHYVRACSTIGSLVRAELPVGAVVGAATGITEVGALVIEAAEEIHTVTAADVVHLRPVRGN